MASLKELASKLGVSPTTVSFVLNGREKEMRISEELAEKIWKTAKEMSYKPNKIAVALRTGRTRIIGLIVEDIGNSFFSSLAKTIEEELSKYDYRVVYCSTENDVKKGESLVHMLQQQQVDGYLLTPCDGMQDGMNAIIKTKVPVVQIDRHFEQINSPYVMVDNYGGIAEAVTHLVKKGRKKIGFVTVDLPLIQMQEREQGFVDTMKKNKLSLKPENILKLDAEWNKEAAAEKIKEYLQTHSLDAVLFATNYVGIAGLQAIKDLKLDIPRELSIICFDDNELFSFCTPTITAIQQPIQEIARAAVEILMNQLSRKKKVMADHVRIPTTLIYRESV